jgi:hypothetical protein
VVRTGSAGAASWLAPIHILCSGGSARGLANPDSRSNYRTFLLRWAKHGAGRWTRSGVPVFLMFSQVDVEFVWILRRIRERQYSHIASEFERYSQESVQAYESFLRELCGWLDPACLRICAIYPPTLSDGSWAKGYLNAHIGYLEGDREIDALAQETSKLQVPDLASRCQMHAEHNERLRQMCADNRLTYIDSFRPFVDASGLVEARFYADHKGEDHHLDYAPTDAIMRDLVTRHLRVERHGGPV